MKNKQLESWIAIVAALVIAAGIGLAGSQGSVTVAGVALFALCGLIAFVINWIVFVPAFALQTEHFYDLTGSLTYLSVVAVGFWLGGASDPRAMLLAALIGLWAVRLGSFLFLRIRKDGKDERFDQVKPFFSRFLMAWTLQGLWVFVTLACALAAMTADAKVPLGWVAWVGAVVWALGFGVEVVADWQKRTFRANPANRGRFIASGLWAWSRHPNYFGEIVLWVGIAIIAVPALSGWQLVTLVSPAFVYLLLTRVSGIPLLEARAQAKWGDDPEYQAYRSGTPALFMRPPAR